MATPSYPTTTTTTTAVERKELVNAPKTKTAERLAASVERRLHISQPKPTVADAAPAPLPSLSFVGPNSRVTISTTRAPLPNLSNVSASPVPSAIPPALASKPKTTKTQSNVNTLDSVKAADRKERKERKERKAREQKKRTRAPPSPDEMIRAAKRAKRAMEEAPLRGDFEANPYTGDPTKTAAFNKAAELIRYHSSKMLAVAEMGEIECATAPNFVVKMSPSGLNQKQKAVDKSKNATAAAVTATESAHRGLLKALMKQGQRNFVCGEYEHHLQLREAASAPEDLGNAVAEYNQMFSGSGGDPDDADPPVPDNGQDDDGEPDDDDEKRPEPDDDGDVPMDAARGG